VRHPSIPLVWRLVLVVTSGSVSVKQMSTPVEDQVVDFYYSLFEAIFTKPFRSKIPERLKRDAVTRQIQDAAGAASQSLTRFLLNEQLTTKDTGSVIGGLLPLHDLLAIEDVANPNIPPEKVAAEVLPRLPCPAKVKDAGKEAVYRLALHSVVQVLKLVGPVMAEWQKLNFSGGYEPSRRIISKLNQISEQLGALGTAGQAARDEKYELTYRDYLLQRFHRVEAGTVRMTTNQDVNLTELFVMPKLLPRIGAGESEAARLSNGATFMDLDAARAHYEMVGGGARGGEAADQPRPGEPALNWVKRRRRNVIVGAPGAGKSTFLEWLQLKLAAGEERLILAGQQAIPVLLRVRQVDPHKLPRGVGLIERATASKDIAALAPPGWIERQMKGGRILFMLDGLDEVEPELRDNKLLPWFLELCKCFPGCRYLVSSRPEGYPAGSFGKKRFAECDLLDFDEPQIQEYTRHWCTAVRLARNEPEPEARREGASDGQRIVEGFERHPYTRNLARNPLMLSAICLVNYFEGGQLPKDRAVLYRLCVEGLLHNWDQRRGIKSEFGFDEKLRVCREVAVSMQADNRAEYEAPRVEAIFVAALGSQMRARKLLEHIRRRTGLLLERRPGVFAFAHLTFQEYLAAHAVHEGNRSGVDAERLVREHDDGRWKEVIALYCGLAPSGATRKVIEDLVRCQNTESLGAVIAEAYLSSGTKLSEDAELRRCVLERIAAAPGDFPPSLGRFPAEEVAPVANKAVGRVAGDYRAVTEAHHWLLRNPSHLDEAALSERLRKWQSMNPFEMAELFHLAHSFGSDRLLFELSQHSEMYGAPGPNFIGEPYGSQAEVALAGFHARVHPRNLTSGAALALCQTLRVLTAEGERSDRSRVERRIRSFLGLRGARLVPEDGGIRLELAALVRNLAGHIADIESQSKDQTVSTLNTWADKLERGSAMNTPE
jgi:hypothetical protein